MRWPAPARQHPERSSRIKEFVSQIKESASRIKEFMLRMWLARPVRPTSHTASLIREENSLMWDARLGASDRPASPRTLEP